MPNTDETNKAVHCTYFSEEVRCVTKLELVQCGNHALSGPKYEDLPVFYWELKQEDALGDPCWVSADSPEDILAALAQFANLPKE